MSAVNEKLEGFKALIKKMKSYEEAIALMAWDLRTGAPRKGVEIRSDTLGVLSTEMFNLSVSEEMGGYLNSLMEPGVYGTLGETERVMLRESKRDYDRNKKIPADRFQAYVTLTTHAESIWEDAKRDNDFPMFQPYLEKIVAFNQEFAELWGYEKHKYDALLDAFEPGMTVEKLDQIFGEVRSKLVPLLQRVTEAKQPNTAFLHQNYPIDKQREFSLYILKEIGYDFDAGRLDVSVHPFMTSLNPGDARVTTRFDPDDLKYALFSTIHEGGHALYEQNISKDLAGTNLAGGTSMGIHESQSRFWENVIGRSYAFWTRYYGELQKKFPEQLGSVDLQTFYEAINEAKPSLIRTESDELTYNLHIMIRYEIEKGLISGDIKVADLPEIWNAKYEEYLGVTPPNNALGVLQDVHWAGGSFGYFPSYSLGNMYAAQILHKLREALPKFEDDVQKGEFGTVLEWLKERIYRFGKLKTPNEICVEVTGEELDPNYLVRYLEDKFTRVYHLQ